MLQFCLIFSKYLEERSNKWRNVLLLSSLQHVKKNKQTKKIPHLFIKTTTTTAFEKV